MPNSIIDYRQLIDKPWGRMFYDMIFRQLDLPNDVSLKILDFGAGFCVTADHYAKYHNVTAVEPNKEMIDLRVQDHSFELLHGGVETLSRFADHTFDVVICHNVLEYASDKELIFRELARVLKQGGTLSIVKHNLLGRAMAYAVFSDDPKAALDLLGGGDHENSMFGNRELYEEDSIIGFGEKCGLSVEDLFGIRTFFALSKNNDVKFTREWYEDMLALEMKTCHSDPYKSISFFHHLIFQKRSNIEPGESMHPITDAMESRGTV